MKKSKIKVVISLMVLLVIMITMNKSYAGMADLTDEMSDTLANEQLANNIKARDVKQFIKKILLKINIKLYLKLR